MSRFLKVSENIFQSLLVPNDDRGMEDVYRQLSHYDILLTDVLWPRSQMITDGQLWCTDGTQVNDCVWWAWPRYDATGAHSCYMISGITKDSGGNPLPGVTVEAYTTADDVFRGKCVSGPDGGYNCPTLINAAHYLRAYLVGNPDVAGTTRNDLTPS
jgi:hypothetical protein